jgi:hypothetical protein
MRVWPGCNSPTVRPDPARETGAGCGPLRSPAPRVALLLRLFLHMGRPAAADKLYAGKTVCPEP